MSVPNAVNDFVNVGAGGVDGPGVVPQAHPVQRRGRDPRLGDGSLDELRAARDLRRIERGRGRGQLGELRLQEQLKLRERGAQIQHLLHCRIVSFNTANVGSAREHRPDTQHRESTR